MIETSLNVNDYPEAPEEEKNELEDMEFMDGYDQIIERKLLEIQEGDKEDE